MNGGSRAGIAAALAAVAALTAVVVISGRDDGGSDGDRHATSTTRSSAAPASTTTVSGPGRPTTTTSTSTASTAEAAEAAEAEGDGWRLVVDRPTTNGTVGPSATLCYRVSAPTREPAVAFDVTLGSATRTIGPRRVDGAVGRGQARVDVADAPAGRYDLTVQLVGNGAPVDGVAVVVRNITVDRAAAAGGCE